MEIFANLTPLVTTAVNAGLAIVLLSVCIILGQRKIMPRWKSGLVYGLVFGALAVATMSAPVEMSDGFLLDARMSLIALASSFGGMLASPVAAIVSAAYRFYLGGGGAIAGTIGALVSGFIGILIARRTWYRHPRDFLGFMALGILNAGQIFLLLWLFSDRAIVREIIARQWESILVANILFSLVIGSAIYIAARQVRVQSRLQESESRLRSIIDHAPESIILKDTKGHFLLVGQTFVNRYGLESEDVIGKTDFDLHPPELAAANLAQDREVIESGETVVRDYPMPLANGSTIIARVTKFPIRDKSGIVSAVASFSVDITEQVEAEERLRQSQKMEAVGHLTGGVAHDFNNLLSIIIGNMELLEEGKDLSEQQLTRIQNAQKAADRAADLTQRLLTFSRKQLLRPRRVDLENLMGNLLPLIRQAAGGNITVSVKSEADIDAVHVDEGQLEGALLNLTLNARDAMPNGGSIDIKLSHTTIEPGNDPSAEAAQPGDYDVISITDNGEGMTPEVVERAFEPFFTTKEAGKGSGLGLSTLYGFVTQSGGTVQLESTPGQGTCIALMFPTVSGQATRETVESLAPSGAPTVNAGLKALIVEDEADVRAMANDILSSLGMETVLANNAEEALAVLKSDDDIRLIFTDVLMPGGNDGFALVRQALEDKPGMKAVVTSGFPDKMQLDAREMPQGAVFIAKPYRKRDISDAVSSLFSE